MSPIRQSAKDNWPLLLLIAALSGGGNTVSTLAMNALGINTPEAVASVTAAQMREIITPIATKLDRMDDRMKGVETYVEIQKDREHRRYPNGENP
jgi:hypothetical protein